MLCHGVCFKCNEYVMIVVSVNYGEIWDKLEGGLGAKITNES